jgi:ribosomal protein S18 acetylase RimI-like enzyme
VARRDDGPRHVRTARLRPDDWQQWRDLRLQALSDAPGAFGSSLAEAQRFEESDWRERLADRAMFAAFSGGEAAGHAVGIAGAMQGDDPDCCDLVSMWVLPAARGCGVGDALVAAVTSFATERNYAHVVLWVTEGNGAAIRLYERHGFAATGRRQPVVPGDTSRWEIEMIRPAVRNGR